jgi:hypothetical protein
MRLDDIIKNIKEERKNNANNHFINIKNTLNNQLNINPLVIKKTNKKDSIDDLLLQISKKYDVVYKQNTIKPKKTAITINLLNFPYNLIRCSFFDL